MKGLIVGIACFIFLGSAASAQSIYSSQGLGSLDYQGSPGNFAMGELGIGTPTVWYINLQNPAYLIFNSFSTFEVGINVESRTFKGDGISSKNATGGLSLLAYSFPIKPGVWSSSFGILPNSTVDYNTFSEGLIEGAPNNATQTLNQRGEGGITNLFWSNGFAINKNLFVGLKSSFLFGSIDRTTIIKITEERTFVDGNGENVTVMVPINTDVNISNIESYKSFNFQLGLAYRYFVSESKFLNIGITLTPKSSFDGKIKKQDSSLASFEEKFSTPRSLGAGISYQKSNVFTIGLDVESQSWESAFPNSNNYQNSLKVAVGGNWTPDYDNVNSYFRRVRYSMGFNYHELPYIVNNQSLTEFGINFGASLPVSGYSSFDLAFKFGQLGETNNGLIKETYFKVVIGATINDRWFIKRKYD